MSCRSADLIASWRVSPDRVYVTPVPRVAKPLGQKESTYSQPSTSRRCDAPRGLSRSHDDCARDSCGFGRRSAIIVANAAVSRWSDPIGTAEDAVERVVDTDATRLLQSALFTKHSRQEEAQHARPDHRGTATSRTRSGPRPPRAMCPRNLDRGKVGR